MENLAEKINSFNIILIAAPEDFSAINSSLKYTADNLTSRIECQNISIVADEIVEDTESFVLLLGAMNPSVEISSDQALVFILDQSGNVSTIIIDCIGC